MNSMRKLRQSGSGAEAVHSFNWSNTERIMTRISRVLFPENDLSSPVKPRRSRLHATMCDSLVNLNQIPSSPTCKVSENEAFKKRSHDEKRAISHGGKGGVLSRSRGRSKGSKLDMRRNRNETQTRGQRRSSRRVTMEGSVLSNLPLLQNETQESKKKKASKKASSRRGRRASRGKENVDSVASGETKRCDFTESKVPSRCSRYTTSVFECLPTQVEQEPHNISLYQSVQVKDSSPAVKSPPTDITQIVHLEIACVYDDECIISPSMAPRASKRTDLKDTPVFVNAREAIEHTEQLLYRKQKVNIDNAFLSPSMAPRAAKRLVDKETTALDEGYNKDNIIVPDPAPNKACKQRDLEMAETRGSVSASGLHLDGNVGGVQSKTELSQSSKGVEGMKMCRTNEVGSKVVSKIPNQTDEILKHADREDNQESERIRTEAVSNGVANTPVLLDQDTSDTCVQNRNSLPVGAKNQFLELETKHISENTVNVGGSAGTIVSLVPSTEDSIELAKREQKAAKKLSSVGLRRSNRNYHPVDRFIATFKRKRKRKNIKALEILTQSPAKGQNTPQICAAKSCNEKGVDQDLLPLKEREAKPRRSCRTSQPIQRFTIFSFGKKKSKTKKNIIIADLKSPCNESDDVEREKGDKEGKKSFDDSKEANESDSEDDIFKATPPALGRSADLSINTDVDPGIELMPCKRVKQKGIGQGEEASNEWTKDLLDLLRQSHWNAEPMCLRFWQDIADAVGSKSAQECRDKWFSLAESPVAHRQKKMFDENSSNEDSSDFDEDDIFNSTPARMSRPGGLTSPNQKGSTRAKPLKRLSDLFSSPLLNRRKKMQSPSQNKSPLFFRPNYKTYLKEVRNGINEKVKFSKIKFSTKKKNKQLSFSASIEEGDLHLRGALSPGGTLFINEPDTDELENMYVAESDVDSIEAM